MGPLFAGRYKLLKRLGGGAQGHALHVADTLRGGAPAVLKLGRSGMESRDGTIAEFEALRMLTTPYIAPVLGLGFAGPRDLALVLEMVDSESMHVGEDTRAYLVRTWVDGPTLLEWSAALRQTDPEVANLRILSVLVHLSEAIAELHQAGLVHGDLKPEHVLVLQDGEVERPVLIDFGLATRGGTQGTLGGTPGYLAPERLRGIPANETSDRFALGVIMAQALVGERVAVRAAARSEHLPEALLSLALPERVIQTIRRLVDADPSQRPALEPARLALLPPSEAVQGWEGGHLRKLPFLGVKRRQSIATLLNRALDNGQSFPPVILLTGGRGSGRSRMLRQIGWELQHAGRPALELFGGERPWQRLLSLGPQLASLSDSSFEDLDPAASGRERTRWLQDLAAALIGVLPRQPVALLWDDIGEEPTEGLETVEGLVLTMERAASGLRLWATTTPERLPALRTLFASAGFEVLELPALTRDDFDGLLGTSSLSGRLSEGELDRLFKRSEGIPGKLTRLLQEDTQVLRAAATTTTGSSLETLVIVLCGLMPGGATLPEMETSAAALGYKAQALRSMVDKCLSRRLISLALPRVDAFDQRAYTAPFLPLAQLPERMQLDLGTGLTPLGVDRPHVQLLAAALRRNEPSLLEAWHQHHERLKAEQTHTLILMILEAALSVTHNDQMLEDFVDTALGSGQLQMAIEALERVQTAAFGGAWRGRLQVARLRLTFAAGHSVASLSDALPEDLSPTDAGHAANILAQVDLRRSRFSEAYERALGGLEGLKALDPSEAEVLRAHLWVTAAAAEVMQGGDTDHRELEKRYGTLESAGATARARARYHAMRAVAAYMQGNLDKATESYRTALEIVDQEGLDAERHVYLLNLGTAYERQGRLSMARQYYDLGARCSLPTSRATTKALLLANRANIDIKLGRTREARELLAAAGRIAHETSLAYVTLFVQQLEADADASEGRLDAAEAVYARCAGTFRDLGDKRHTCELFIKAGLAAARADRPQSARGYLDAAGADIEEYSDLKHRASILRAELILARGGADRMIGVDRYLRALERALDTGDDLTVLTEARWLMRRLSFADGGPDPLALRELAATASRAWRRVALSLTQELRRDMSHHLGLDKLLSSDTEPTPPPINPTGTDTPDTWTASATALTMSAPIKPLLGPSQVSVRPTLRSFAQAGEAERREVEIADRFFRMLSLNRRIIGENDLERLIPAALDIALSLTGADRGFLLLRDDDSAPFEVAFSRDVDGRPIDEDRLQISATIARQVASEGQPIVTEDASQDQRFGQAMSVHQLQLTSILCVPIRDRDRNLGCLYLDHRGASGAFEGIIPRMIASYADQVAIALVSARHVSDLRHERDELHRAQAQIKTLLADKEELLLDLETRCHRLEADLARERNATGLRFNYDHLIAQAPAMQRVLSQVDRVIDTVLPVVVQGESGTGKEVIARAIHFNGTRRSNPFVAINCGALAESLLESELFGHKKGAFTGAVHDRKGLFEAASGGTLFLDEVGEMSLSMQVKLLRALQEKRIRPVGAVHEVAVDVRVIAATNRDLIHMAREGDFREDLYYRLATLVVHLPPLRDRREDIPLLIRHILSRAVASSNRSATPNVTGPAVALLMQHRWPGNIRQLENVIRAAMVLCDDEITPDLLASLLPRTHTSGPQPTTPLPPTPRTFQPPGRPPKCTPEQVAEALRLSHGNRANAARRLNVSLRTLQRYLKKQ